MQIAYGRATLIVTAITGRDIAMRGIKGKNVLITGAASGIGRATAVRFAEEGANVGILDLDLEGAQETVSQIVAAGGKGLAEQADIADYASVKSAVAALEAGMGPIDILVNNAGYHARGPIENLDATEVGRMIDVNLKAAAILTRLALPHLREAGGGAIINVGSLAGRTPVPGSAGYAASKAGLRSFTYSLGIELEDDDIKLAVVSPGPIDTGFIMADIDATSDITFSQPMSTADEVAQAILDLCGNKVKEESMPRISGVLTMIMYLFPGLRKYVQPSLERKGAKVKARLKRERMRPGSDSPDRQPIP